MTYVGNQDVVAKRSEIMIFHISGNNGIRTLFYGLTDKESTGSTAYGRTLYYEHRTMGRIAERPDIELFFDL